MLLHLRILLGLRPSPLVLPCSLSHAVETWSSPQKILVKILSGGDEGNRTPVRRAFMSKGLQQFLKLVLVDILAPLIIGFQELFYHDQ